MSCGKVEKSAFFPCQPTTTPRNQMTTYPTFSSPANCTPIETTHKTTQSKVVSKLVASRDFEVKCSYNRTIKGLKGGDIGGFSLCNDGLMLYLMDINA